MAARPVAEDAGSVRVLVVADAALSRDTLLRVLAASGGIDPRACSFDEDSVTAQCADGHPQVVVAVPLTGEARAATVVESLARLRERLACTARLVAIARQVEPRDARRCLALGATGYLTIVDGLAAVEDAVRCAAAGLPYVGPSVGVALAADDAADAEGSLTARERDLLRLLALGYTNAEAARELRYSVRTVEADRAHLCRRLGVRRRRDIVRAAMDVGLLRTVAF